VNARAEIDRETENAVAELEIAHAHGAANLFLGRMAGGLAGSFASLG